MNLRETVSNLTTNFTTRPFFIQSNFGSTNFLGTGQAPKRVLTDIEFLLEQFNPERWCGQATKIIRVEAKVCPHMTALIEIEQRPAGLGVFLEAGKRMNIVPRMDVNLEKTTVLYSVGRTKNGVFLSDEHLFTQHIFPWDESRDIETDFLVIRAREDEVMPHWLLLEFTSPVSKSPTMLLLRRNADKAKVYADLDLPHKIFPEKLDDTISHASYVKEVFMNAAGLFGTNRIVLKPRRGSRAREVSIIDISGEHMRGINGKSQIVKNIRKHQQEYVLQPYYKGICEDDQGMCHLYRMFFIAEKSRWRYIGGFLALDHQNIVHGANHVQNILLTS